MEVNISKKGPVIEAGLCRCCGLVKRCRLLNVEYVWCGEKEVYADMFLDSFGLCLSHLDGEPEERVICATCVSRLRDACAFRRQVLQCEQKLLQAQLASDEGLIKQELDIKIEADDDICDSLPEAMDHTDHYDDNIPLDVKVDTWKAEVKETKRRSKRNKASDTRAKKEMLVKIKKMKDELKQLENDDMDLMPPQMPPAMRPWKSNSAKAFHNTITLVVNSYVCPFVTTFSDYHCVYCKELYTDPDKLREHTLTHDPTTYQDTVTYKKSLLIDITRIDCRLCPKPIDDLEEFYSHITSFHDKMLYPNIKNEFLKFRLKLGNLSCLECGNIFTYFHALKKHMAEHFGTWICDICGAHFFEEGKLIIHQKSHQPQKTEDTYPCKDCGRVFKSKHGRYYHISRVHSEQPAYPCYKCDEVLFSHSLRYRHMIEVHGEQRTFPCEHCDKVYDTRKSLREHNRKNHLKVLKHECNVCEKKFYLPSALKDHMASHTGERNFRCEYCGKSYPRMRALRVHVQSHDSEKKYKCAICSASYTQSNNLKHHIRAKHQSVMLDQLE
ncbi:zinc finger protein 37 homolog [Ostrinia nubilalis]|uniref:zinc finger protein 37 homolog n=1 Tax=Ostrinia nubilalis TaxID=29057 RepID=UPI0030824F32